MDDKPTSGDSIEIVLGTLLRYGTILSAIVIALGGVGYLWTSGGDTPHYGVFRGEPQELATVHGIVREAMSLDPREVIQFGLLLLIGTPIARVIGALVAFAWQRDRTYVVVSSLVLAALLYGLLAS
jgi:uncharacterized membrane protein